MLNIHQKISEKKKDANKIKKNGIKIVFEGSWRLSIWKILKNAKVLKSF